MVIGDGVNPLWKNSFDVHLVLALDGKHNVKVYVDSIVFPPKSAVDVVKSKKGAEILNFIILTTKKTYFTFLYCAVSDNWNDKIPKLIELGNCYIRSIVFQSNIRFPWSWFLFFFEIVCMFLVLAQLLEEKQNNLLALKLHYSINYCLKSLEEFITQ
jgi:hypothetical protein